MKRKIIGYFNNRPIYGRDNIDTTGPIIFSPIDIAKIIEYAEKNNSCSVCEAMIRDKGYCERCKQWRTWDSLLTDDETHELLRMLILVLGYFPSVRQDHR